jgi:hypothetical protein
MCEANGIKEVGSSILPDSTNLPNDTKTISRPSGRFWFIGGVVKSDKVGWAAQVKVICALNNP